MRLKNSQHEGGYVLVLNAIMIAMIAMFMALAINTFILITARLQQRNVAEGIAMAILHHQKSYALATETDFINVGLEVGKQRVLGLKTADLVVAGDLVFGSNVHFGTWNAGTSTFTPEGLPGPRTAIRVTLPSKTNSIMMMGLGLFGLDDHPFFRSTAIVAYQATANPNHQRYFIVS